MCVCVIIEGYGVCMTPPHMCFVMELLSGSLSQLIKKEGPLEFKLLIRLAREIALGVSALHEAKIIHRDLKPDNILVFFSSFLLFTLSFIQIHSNSLILSLSLSCPHSKVG
jgi:serine/threonine protein kinase